MAELLVPLPPLPPPLFFTVNGFWYIYYDILVLRVKLVTVEVGRLRGEHNVGIMRCRMGLEMEGGINVELS
jgi:hypothetical protein